MTLWIVALVMLPFGGLIAYRAGSLIAFLPIGKRPRRKWRKESLFAAGITLLLTDALFTYIVKGVLARFGVR